MRRNFDHLGLDKGLFFRASRGRRKPGAAMPCSARTLQGVTVKHRTTVAITLIAVSALAALAGCGSSGSSTPATAASGAATRGGDLVIARTADSQSMNKTTVFDNESIWIFEQIFQTLYTVTPDGHFLIDRLPGAPNIIVASPCSGHGFKFAPVIGEILADLAITGTTPHDIARFSLARFG